MVKKLILLFILFLSIVGSLAAAEKRIVLNTEETKSIWFDSILSVINTHPEIVKAEKVSKKEIKLYANNPGEAFIHVKNYDNKITSYKIKVLGKMEVYRRKQRKAAREAISGQYSNYFKNDNDATYHVNRWMHTHELILKSPTILGSNATRLLFKSQLAATNNSEEQIEYFSTRFRGNKYNVILGDDVVSYSELMAPGLTYQGMRLQLYSIFDLLDFEIFSGNRGNIHWGEKVRDDTAPSYNVFGTKLNYKANQKLNLKSTYLRSLEGDKASVSKLLEVRSVGFDYRWNKNLNFNGEAASARRNNFDSPAVRVQTQWQNEVLNLNCVFRDITAGYETVSNWLDYSGQKGVYLYTRYKPSSYWSLGGSFQSFLRRFQSPVINDDFNEYRNRATFALHKISFMSPAVSIWRNFTTKSMWEGTTFRLAQINFLKPYITFYYEFSPSKYRDYDNTDFSYEQQIGLLGAVYRPVKLIEWRLERQWEFYNFHSGFKDNPRGANLIFNWGSIKFFKTSINTVFSLRYQYRQNGAMTTDQSLYSGSLQLRDNFTPDLSWYFRLIGVSQHIKNYKWNLGHYEYDDDNIRSEISGGITYIF